MDDAGSAHPSAQQPSVRHPSAHHPSAHHQLGQHPLDQHPRDRPRLVYDGDCGFCTSAVRRLAPLLSRYDGTDPELVAWQLTDLAAIGVDQSRAEREVLWIESRTCVEEQQVRGGAQAFASWLIHRGGGYGLAGRLIRLPVVRAVAALGYHLVSVNRGRLPGGTPACALPPAERPGGDLSRPRGRQ